jgi:hypothetical protein
MSVIQGSQERSASGLLLGFLQLQRVVILRSALKCLGDWHRATHHATMLSVPFEYCVLTRLAALSLVCEAWNTWICGATSAGDMHMHLMLT